MSHEIVAADPMSQMPVDPAILRQLSERYHFSEDYLLEKTHEQQNLVQGELGRLGIVLDMSSPMALDPPPDIIGGETSSYPLDSFEASYERVKRTPHRKFEYDSALANNLLLKLGPTNQLRTREGFDGGIELGKVIHLLETDFADLPAAEQQPEYRLTEALFREELALLWRPTTPNKFENNPHKAFMLDLSDPNLFTKEQIQTLSEPDRWKMIGARLSDEAADVFQAIAESPTANISEKLAANCRMTDMKIRSLRIQAGMSTDKVQKQGLYDRIALLNTEYLGILAAVWRHPSTKRSIKDSLFFELFVVGQERDEIIKNQEVNQLVRLALPREDTIHPDIYPYINSRRVLVNMSVDAVVEDTSGNFVKAYQVKAMPHSLYDKLQERRKQEVGELIYLPGHTEMRFADDYPLVSNGIDLKSLMVHRNAA